MAKYYNEDSGDSLQQYGLLEERGDKQDNYRERFLDSIGRVRGKALNLFRILIACAALNSVNVTGVAAQQQLATAPAQQPDTQQTVDNIKKNIEALGQLVEQLGSLITTSTSTATVSPIVGSNNNNPTFTTTNKEGVSTTVSIGEEIVKLWQLTTKIEKALENYKNMLESYKVEVSQKFEKSDVAISVINKELKEHSSELDKQSKKLTDFIKKLNEGAEFIITKKDLNKK